MKLQLSGGCGAPGAFEAVQRVHPGAPNIFMRRLARRIREYEDNGAHAGAAGRAFRVRPPQCAVIGSAQRGSLKCATDLGGCILLHGSSG